jgi:hypothetical protein
MAPLAPLLHRGTKQIPADVDRPAKQISSQQQLRSCFCRWELAGFPSFCRWDPALRALGNLGSGPAPPPLAMVKTRARLEWVDLLENPGRQFCACPRHARASSIHLRHLHQLITGLVEGLTLQRDYASCLVCEEEATEFRCAFAVPARCQAGWGGQPIDGSAPPGSVATIPDGRPNGRKWCAAFVPA